MEIEHKSYVVTIAVTALLYESIILHTGNRLVAYRFVPLLSPQFVRLSQSETFGSEIPNRHKEDRTPLPHKQDLVHQQYRIK